MIIPVPPSRSARGFTLIELMIAVAIVGILVKLAYPAYTQSVKKSRRAEAKTALLDLAQREERFYSTQNKYSTTASPDLGYNSGATFPIPVVSGSTAYYTLTVTPTAANATAGTAAGFMATAAPTSAGNQSADVCGSYTLNNLGQQGITGSATVTDCW